MFSQNQNFTQLALLRHNVYILILRARNCISTNNLISRDISPFSRAEEITPWEWDWLKKLIGVNKELPCHVSATHAITFGKKRRDRCWLTPSVKTLFIRETLLLSGTKFPIDVTILKRKKVTFCRYYVKLRMFFPIGYAILAPRYLKAAKYGIHKPSTCRATLFRSKFWVDVSRFSPCAINLSCNNKICWRNAARWLVDLLGVDLIWRHLLRDKLWVWWKTSNKAKICCSR